MAVSAIFSSIRFSIHNCLLSIRPIPNRSKNGQYSAEPKIMPNLRCIPSNKVQKKLMNPKHLLTNNVIMGYSGARIYVGSIGQFKFMNNYLINYYNQVNLICKFFVTLFIL